MIGGGSCAGVRSNSLSRREPAIPRSMRMYRGTSLESDGMVKTAALISMIAGLWALPVPVSAQSLEELKQEIKRLQERIERLETRTESVEPIGIEPAGTESAGTEPQVVTRGSPGVSLEVSGQVNRGELYVDNGDDREFFNVDNDNSSTRLRFIGKGEFNDDFSVGTQIEVQFESNSTAAIRIDQDSPAGPNNFAERKLELYLDSKKYGRLWLGQGDTASNSTSERDLSGTTVVGYSGIADFAGGIAFQDDGVLGPRINQVFNNFDGLGRDDRVRYDTPAFAGFDLSASAVDGGSYDAAARFAGKYADTKVVGALAYANANARQGFDQLNGSASALFPTGVSVTGAAGTRDTDGRSDDALFYYAKLGYTFRPFSWGDTSIAVDYAHTDDLAQDGDDFDSVWILFAQNLDVVSTEIYLGLRNHSLDRAGADFDDIFAVLLGGRVKF